MLRIVTVVEVWRRLASAFSSATEIMSELFERLISTDFVAPGNSVVEPLSRIKIASPSSMKIGFPSRAKKSYQRLFYYLTK
jgi:hypothetical protein